MNDERLKEIAESAERRAEALPHNGIQRDTAAALRELLAIRERAADWADDDTVTGAMVRSVVHGNMAAGCGGVQSVHTDAEVRRAVTAAWEIDEAPDMTAKEAADAVVRRLAPGAQVVKRMDRESLGRKVREVWVAWAHEQPNPKPSWLVPWEGLSEPDKEVDRRIGEALVAYGDVAQAPERRYSEEEVRLTALEVELCAQWQSERARDGFKAGWTEVMRRLRGDGEAPKLSPERVARAKAAEKFLVEVPPEPPGDDPDYGFDERLFSEEEVRKAIVTSKIPEATGFDSDEVADEILRRLRGQVEAKPAPTGECDLHELGLPGTCTCHEVPA